jgi:hypothetical protein
MRELAATALTTKLDPAAKLYGSSATALASSAWDADMIHSCLCDTMPYFDGASKGATDSLQFSLQYSNFLSLSRITFAALQHERRARYMAKQHCALSYTAAVVVRAALLRCWQCYD